jgi:hypothetical protein
MDADLTPSIPCAILDSNRSTKHKDVLPMVERLKIMPVRDLSPLASMSYNITLLAAFWQFASDLTCTVMQPGLEPLVILRNEN